VRPADRTGAPPVLISAPDGSSDGDPVWGNDEYFRDETGCARKNQRYGHLCDSLFSEWTIAYGEILAVSLKFEKMLIYLQMNQK